MTLDQFTQILAEMDRRSCPGDNGAEFFNCRPVELIPGRRYGYLFDGFLQCVAEFMPDGTVRDGQDVPFELDAPEHPWHWKTYPSVEAYKDALITQFTTVL